MKKIFYTVGTILGFILLLLLGYIVYLYVDYDRLPDNIALEPKQNSKEKLPTEQTLRAMTFNIGYGAYTSDYTFFMDGGESTRAKDRKTVLENMEGIVETTENVDPTIAFFQEVDQDGDRSQHVDEVDFLQKSFAQKSSVYGQNYDSSYLFYPFLEPIGQATSGLVTLSQSNILQATRYSLPIETNFNKFFDLDRAFTVSRIPVENQKELLAINVHLSAYTKDPVVQEQQMQKLFDIMETEYQKDNYVIVGGDYNHDLLGISPEIFATTENRHSWDQPFPEESLPENFHIPKDNLAEEKVPSTRKLDTFYEKGSSYVSLLDGFILSDNLTVEAVEVEDEEFINSDHNPVWLDFQLADKTND